MAYAGEIVVTGLGMVSSLGHGAEQSCASVRARITRFQEDDSFLCQAGPPGWEEEPLVGARIASLDAGPDRIRGMALAAFQELIQNARLTREEFAGAGLYLSLPPASRPGPEGRDDAGLPSGTLEGLSAGRERPASVIAAGHAGSFLAMEQAAAAIREGKRDLCLVAGADSYFEDEILERLDAARRLKSSWNSGGFVPGEGAAAILLEPRHRAERRRATLLAGVEKIGTALEANIFGSPSPCRGDGLAQAIATCAAGDGGTGPDWVTCDLNGENDRAMEWGLCQVRLRGLLAGVRHLWHPADCLGDLGAATGAFLVALVSRAFQRGYAPAERCLLWTSSDGPERAALMLRRAGPVG